MTLRIGNHVVRLVIIALIAGTLADYLTRQFTLDPTIIAATWAIFFLILLVGYRLLSTTQSSPTLLQEINGRAKNIVLAHGVAFAALFAFILKSRRSDFIFTISNVTAFAIVLIGVAGYFVSQKMLRPLTSEHTQEQWTGINDVFLLGCVVIGTFFASVTYRASTDDMYYVNLSTYIYENGVVPTRDTVLSDQVFNTYPRLTSWEVLWGVAGHVLHVHPGTLLYIVWVPFATALSYIVLAKMFTTFGVKNIKTALLAATLFLCFDGASGFTFGAYQGTRIWQGKSFFLALLLPLIFIYLLKLLREPNRTNSLVLMGLFVASIGATTTAIILLAPLLAVAFIIAFIHQRKALAPLGLASAYLLTLAFAYYSLRTQEIGEVSARGMGAGIRIAENSTGTLMPATYDMLTELVKPWWHAATIMLAIFLGWIALRGQFARPLVALSFAMWGILCLPGLHEVILNAIGARTIAWRFIWLIPIPMLIGAAASALKDGVFTKKSSLLSSSLALTWSALLFVLPMTIGTPPWQIAPQSNLDAQLAKPIYWRDGFSFRHAWEAIQKVAQPEDVILARNGISSSLNVRTTKYYTVAPRDMYVNYVVQGFPNGHAAERIKLAQYVVGKEPVTYQPGEMQQALNLVRVNVVCLPQDRQNDIDLFKSLGYSDNEAKAYKPGDKKSWFWCGRTNQYDN